MLRCGWRILTAMIDKVRILEALEASGLVGRPLRRKAMELLSEEPGYDWVGVYTLHGNELLLDEFVGAATEHTHIPVGKGVCGAAIAENRNVIVDDVRDIENYLACSVDTRSEIVVLIRNQEGKVLGQIDADGHEVAAFGPQDENALGEIAEFLADRWNEIG
jgi:GAF domain-containing protein